MPKTTTMTPQEFAQDTTDQLRYLTIAAVRIGSHVQALQHILDAAIAAHPNPKGVLNLLELARPELVDDLVGTPPEGDAAIGYEVRQQAFQEALAHYTKLLNAVIDSRNTQESDDN